MMGIQRSKCESEMVCLALSAFGSFPFVFVDSRWHVAFELMNHVEFHSIQISIGSDNSIPGHGNKPPRNWNEDREIGAVSTCSNKTIEGRQKCLNR